MGTSELKCSHIPIPATSPLTSLHEGTSPRPGGTRPTNSSQRKRFEEQVAGTCPNNSNWFEFVGLVAGTKVWSLWLYFKAQMASSHAGSFPCDLLQGLVPSCVPTLMLGVALRWTSIPSRGEQKYSKSLHASETEIRSGLMGHLARMQISPLFYTVVKVKILSKRWPRRGYLYDTEVPTCVIYRFTKSTSCLVVSISVQLFLQGGISRLNQASRSLDDMKRALGKTRSFFKAMVSVYVLNWN